MLEAIKKADVLVEAMGWIRKLRGQTTVIKLGGSLMEDQDAMRHILIDVVFMETVGMFPVIVHGGGAAISKAMDAAGLVPRFVHGRRYTDLATLEIVEAILATEVNEGLCETIRRLEGQAAALNFRSRNVLFGDRLQLNVDGELLDLGYVGGVDRVDAGHLQQLGRQGIIPVIPSMSQGPNGQKYNVNADTAATAVARELKAQKLVYLSDVNGVRRDKNDPNSLIHSLRASEARELIRNGTISAGMIPKVEACLDTLDQGVDKVHIIDGRIRHSLLLEIYTTSGVGTEIIR